MKPFNLKEALEGKPVVTRDGREVTQLTFFTGTNNECPVHAVIGDEIESFTTEGEYIKGNSDEFDLFMGPVKTKYYVYIYSFGNKRYGAGEPTTLDWDTFCLNPTLKNSLIHTFELEIEE